MRDLKTISHDFMTNLGLKYEPVGVTLYLQADELPADIPLAKGILKAIVRLSF